MRRLATVFLQISLIALLFFKIFQCDRWNGSASWVVEWTFVDTTKFIDPLSYLIEVRSGNKNDNFDLDGYVYNNGILFESFSTEDESLFLPENPTLRMKIFNVEDSSIVYDSLLTWEQMDFKEQKSEVENYVYNNLSKKTIYLDSIKSEFLLLLKNN